MEVEPLSNYLSANALFQTAPSVPQNSSLGDLWRTCDDEFKRQRDKARGIASDGHRKNKGSSGYLLPVVEKRNAPTSEGKDRGLRGSPSFGSLAGLDKTARLTSNGIVPFFDNDNDIHLSNTEIDRFQERRKSVKTRKSPLKDDPIKRHLSRKKSSSHTNTAPGTMTEFRPRATAPVIKQKPKQRFTLSQVYTSTKNTEEVIQMKSKANTSKNKIEEDNEGEDDEDDFASKGATPSRQKLLTNEVNPLNIPEQAAEDPLGLDRVIQMTRRCQNSLNKYFHMKTFGENNLDNARLKRFQILKKKQEIPLARIIRKQNLSGRVVRPWVESENEDINRQILKIQAQKEIIEDVFGQLKKDVKSIRSLKERLYD